VAVVKAGMWNEFPQHRGCGLQGASAMAIHRKRNRGERTPDRHESDNNTVLPTEGRCRSDPCGRSVAGCDEWGDHKGRPYNGRCWTTPLVRPLRRYVCVDPPIPADRLKRSTSPVSGLWVHFTFSQRRFRFGLSRELVICVGYSLHGSLGFPILCFLRGYTHLLGTRAPMIRIIDELTKLPHYLSPFTSISSSANADTRPPGFPGKGPVSCHVGNRT